MRPARGIAATGRSRPRGLLQNGILPLEMGRCGLAQCINDALGVRTKAAPGGPGRPASGMSEGGIDAGEAGGGEPPRRLSGGRCGRSRRQACAARCRRRRRWCPHRRRTECAGTRRKRRSGGRWRRAMRRACRSGSGGERSEPPCKRSARRREGYPPEGSRPRSGLGRVARSRSDAPNLISEFPASVIIIDTLGVTTVCTTDGITVTVICTNLGINTANTANTRCALPTSMARRRTALPERCRTGGTRSHRCDRTGDCASGSGGRAAKLPRSAAPQAPCDAKANANGGAPSGSDQRERAAPPGGDATLMAMRLRPRNAAPGCRARPPCRPGCR